MNMTWRMANGLSALLVRLSLVESLLSTVCTTSMTDESMIIDQSKKQKLLWSMIYDHHLWVPEVVPLLGLFNDRVSRKLGECFSVETECFDYQQQIMTREGIKGGRFGKRPNFLRDFFPLPNAGTWLVSLSMMPIMMWLRWYGIWLITYMQQPGSEHYMSTLLPTAHDCLQLPNLVKKRPIM